MLTDMLDTNICIYVMKNYPEALRAFDPVATPPCGAARWSFDSVPIE
jgi:hypothetical protein